MIEEVQRNGYKMSVSAIRTSKDGKAMLECRPGKWRKAAYTTNDLVMELQECKGFELEPTDDNGNRLLCWRFLYY